jgi:hypothetical protein
MSRPLEAIQVSEPAGNREQTSLQARRQALHQVATNFDRRDPATSPLTELEIEMLNNEYDRNIAFAHDTETHRSTAMTFVVAGIGAVVYALAAKIQSFLLVSSAYRNIARRICRDFGQYLSRKMDVPYDDRSWLSFENCSGPSRCAPRGAS